MPEGLCATYKGCPCPVSLQISMKGVETMMAAEARLKLQALASPEVAAGSARYFKTGPGEYGEGDIFIGVRVPTLRKLARESRAMPLAEVETLLQSTFHEERLLALLILVQGLGRCDAEWRKAVFELYCRNTKYVNQWDLVDSSAPAIVGGYLVEKSRKPLERLAESACLWERRIAIVATQHFIRINQFDDTLAISRKLLTDKEDLIHKASGWMLREVGERDLPRLIQFLDQYYNVMPRTMLRYAIEKLTPALRQEYLKGTRNLK